MRLMKLLRLAALALSLTLLATACGTDDNSTGEAAANVENCATGVVAGAGSTFVQTIAQEWIKSYGSACAGSTVNYQGVGSGAGIQQFLSGTVDFAGSDVPLSKTEREAAVAKYGSIVELPWAAGGIALAYNLSGVDVQLSPVTVAKIFNGSITRWDDPAIVDDNNGAQMPKLPIQMVHRSDGSGTTQAFTAFLEGTASNVWKLGSSKEIDWPIGQGAKGSDGVTSAVKAAEGTITYVELSYARANNLGVVKVRNGSGEYTAPDAPNVAAALESAALNEDGSVSASYDSTNAAAYPITTVTYVISAKNPSDQSRSALFKSFATYAVSGGQDSAERLFYAPMPTNISTAAAGVLASVGSGG